MTQREAEKLAKLMDAEISHTVDLDIMHHQAAMLLRSQAVEIKSLKAAQAQAAVEPNSWEALYWAQVDLKEAAVKKMHKVNDLLLGKQAQAAVSDRIKELEDTVFNLNRALRDATEGPTFMGEPMQMALATPEGGTKYVNVQVQAAQTQAAPMQDVHAEVVASHIQNIRCVKPLECPKCHALWLFWPKEQSGFVTDTLSVKSATHCNYCENARADQLISLDRVQAAQAQAAAPGDIRALKYRIHELEGEVIGYKRILDEPPFKVAPAAEPVAFVVALDGKPIAMAVPVQNIDLLAGMHEAPLYIKPQGASDTEMAEAIRFTMKQSIVIAKQEVAMRLALSAMLRYVDKRADYETFETAIATLEKELK